MPKNGHFWGFLETSLAGQSPKGIALAIFGQKCEILRNFSFFRKRRVRFLGSDFSLFEKSHSPEGPSSKGTLERDLQKCKICNFSLKNTKNLVFWNVEPPGGRFLVLFAKFEVSFDRLLVSFWPKSHKFGQNFWTNLLKKVTKIFHILRFWNLRISQKIHSIFHCRLPRFLRENEVCYFQGKCKTESDPRKSSFSWDQIFDKFDAILQIANIPLPVAIWETEFHWKFLVCN